VVKNVLVIDDEEGIRKLFVRALEDTPYQVDTAESGEKGLEMQRMVRYSLIFLDLTMPGMNGIEVLREIRMNDKNVPIYIITAFYKNYVDGLTDNYEKGLIFKIAHKPLTMEQIVFITKETLEGSNTQKFIKNILKLKLGSMKKRIKKGG
jgi:DNA-binding response OmpR family regulator